MAEKLRRNDGGTVRWPARRGALRRHLFFADEMQADVFRVRIERWQRLLSPATS